MKIQKDNKILSKSEFSWKNYIKFLSQNSIDIQFLFLIEDNHCPEKKYFFMSRGPLGKGNELGKNPFVGSKVRVLSWIPCKDFFLTSLFFPRDPETQNYSQNIYQWAIQSSTGKRKWVRQKSFCRIQGLDPVLNPTKAFCSNFISFPWGP